MVRVIKKGKISPALFRGSCPHCKSVLEEDRQKGNVESCPREHYEFMHVTCPECNHSAVLYPKK